MTSPVAIVCFKLNALVSRFTPYIIVRGLLGLGQGPHELLTNTQAALMIFMRKGTTCCFAVLQSTSSCFPYTLFPFEINKKCSH